MFEKLGSVIEESKSELDQLLKGEISQNRKTLEKDVQRYFPELSREETSMARALWPVTLLSR